MATKDVFDDIFDLSKSLSKTKKAHGKPRKDSQAPDTKNAHLGEHIGSRVKNKGVKGSNPPVDRTLAPKKGPGEKTRKSVFPNAEPFRAFVWENPDNDAKLAENVRDGISTPSLRNPRIENQ